MDRGGLYSRCLVANAADPVGVAGGRGSRHVVLATSFANPLAAGLAQGAAIDDPTESGATASAAPSAAVVLSMLLRRLVMIRTRRRLLIVRRLQGAFLPQKLQLRL